jgi:hypothetical protein
MIVIIYTLRLSTLQQIKSCVHSLDAEAGAMLPFREKKKVESVIH